MNIGDKVKTILDEALALGGRSAEWTDDTALLLLEVQMLPIHGPHNIMPIRQRPTVIPPPA